MVSKLSLNSASTFVLALNLAMNLLMTTGCGSSNQISSTNSAEKIAASEINQKKILYIGKLDKLKTLAVSIAAKNGSASTLNTLNLAGNDLQVLAVRDRYCFVVTANDVGFGAKELFFVKGAACRVENVRDFKVSQIEAVISKGSYLWYATVEEIGTIELQGSEIGKLDLTYAGSKKNVGKVYGLCQDFAYGAATVPTSFFDECDISLGQSNGIWEMSLMLQPRFSKANALAAFEILLKTMPNIPVYNTSVKWPVTETAAGIYRQGTNHTYTIWYRKPISEFGACNLSVPVSIELDEKSKIYSYNIKNPPQLTWVCDAKI